MKWEILSLLITIISVFILAVFLAKRFHLFLAKNCDFSNPVKEYEYNGVKVKEVNCSSANWGWYRLDENTIYVNYRLPKLLKKYIIAHEYCHSTYAGPKFNSVWSEIKCIFLVKGRNKNR